MFGLFKTDPRKKLEKAFAEKLEAARKAQHEGNMELFGQLTTEAEDIITRIEKLPNGKAPLLLI